MNKIILFLLLFILIFNIVYSDSRYHDYLNFNGMKTEFRAINGSGIITITVEAIGLIDFNRSVSSTFPITSLIPNTPIASVGTGRCNGSQQIALRIAFFGKSLFIQSLEPTVNDCNAIAIDPFTIQWVSNWC